MAEESSLSPREILAAIQRAQREAAQLMLAARVILAESKTDHRNVVTEYDRRVQALLMERLTAAVPGARFFCEESDRNDDLGAEHLFIIDPIDGTMNFVHHLNHSAISVAYTHYGVPEAGAVYNPYVDEMFSALRGEGACLNGRPIRVDPAPLSETVICFGTAPYDESKMSRSFVLAERACRAGLDVRRQGSAALDLCSVAAGRAGAYFELQVSLWDYAAGALIVSEAGGRVTDIHGSPLPFDGSKPTILAASPENSCSFLEMANS